MKNYITIIFTLLITFYSRRCTKNITQQEGNNSNIQISSTDRSGQSSVFTGNVKDMTSKEPLVGVQVYLLDKAGKKAVTLTDAAGNFTIKDVALGVYTLTCSNSDYMTAETTIEIKHVSNYTVAVQLAQQIKLIEKPVIYLYPTQKQQVHVKVNFAGFLAHSYPNYPSNGWTVTAEPNGTLLDENGKEYYALFWEGKANQQIVPKDGFVVAGKETEKFLEEKLAYLGLNRKEANEFIMYWLPRMEDNAYNFIHFAGKQYEEQAPLDIQPKPETVIRVMMLTQALHSNIQVPTQDLSPLKKSRKGFTVVEWGGTVIDSVIESF
jgi:CarboxypepD_reg-like domain